MCVGALTNMVDHNHYLDHYQCCRLFSQKEAPQKPDRSTQTESVIVTVPEPGTEQRSGSRSSTCTSAGKLQDTSFISPSALFHSTALCIPHIPYISDLLCFGVFGITLHLSILPLFMHILCSLPFQEEMLLQLILCLPHLAPSCPIISWLE